MPDTEFIPKTEAIDEIRRTTGYGRFIVERKMDQLLEAGKIDIIDDPGDLRRKLISRDDVQRVIASLQVSKRA